MQQISTAAEQHVAEQVRQLSVSLFEKEQAKTQMFQQQLEKYHSALSQEEAWKNEWKRKSEEAESANRQILDNRKQEMELMEQTMIKNQEEFQQQFQALQIQLHKTQETGASQEESKKALDIVLQRAHGHYQNLAVAQAQKEEAEKKAIEDAQRAAQQKESIHEKHMESAKIRRDEIQQQVMTTRARCDALSIAVAEE